MNKTLKDFFSDTLVVVLLCAPVGISLYYHQRNMEQELEQRGYVIPSKFSFSWSRPVRDVDNDGLRESIAKYKGTNYLFKINTNGIPYFVPYKVNLEEKK